MKLLKNLFTYADRTLCIFVDIDPSWDNTFLPAPNRFSQTEKADPIAVKVSKSDVLECATSGPCQTSVIQQETLNQVVTDASDWTHDRGHDYFATDTSQVEVLYDSAGVDGAPNQPTSCIQNSDHFSTQRDGDMHDKIPSEEA